ncbi:MAG TPA: hypothetical protein VFD45_00675 [Patescibacteria group bacterium]|nr:hypothetical protein [Patescibacteria group bacterium]
MRRPEDLGPMMSDKRAAMLILGDARRRAIEEIMSEGGVVRDGRSGHEAFMINEARYCGLTSKQIREIPPEEYRVF